MRRALRLATALLVPVVLLAAAFAQVSPGKIKVAALQCREGDKAFQAGDRDAALEAYEKALKAVPGYPDAHTGLGTLWLGEGKAVEALAEYRKALEGYASLGDAMAQVDLQRYSEVQGRKTALRDEQAALMSPSSRLSAAAKQSRLAAIDTEMRQLETVQPPDGSRRPEAPGTIHFHIGNALMRLDRPSEALTEWEACAAASPKFAPVHNNLAFAYWKQGRFDEARRALARAEELGFPVNPQFKQDLSGAGK